MPSVKDESVRDKKPMATNAIVTGVEEPDDEKPSHPQPSRPPTPIGGSSGSGFFTIYKKGQGKWTRLGTVFAAILIALLTAYNLYTDYLPRYIHNRHIVLAIVAGFLAGFALLVFWLMNKPRHADFLIATDSEMKKVNWTTQGELFGSTKVVVLFLFSVAIFLFVVDQIFELLFWSLNVIKIEPWYVESFRQWFHH